ncbi:MAG: hypothetical protein H6626_06945 [Pseudobdellovibrionaceae bacterium]|nr:hypothetical protein [Bdellovibrionales bacterium]USN48819.1 MAG: hypothetical protein H6626_06945 [Pseudobdellovibrionaceae bacterium]
MKHLMRILSLGTFFALGLASAHAGPIKHQANSLTIVDIHQEPIANAQVLIGRAVDNPFPGNLLVSDDKGEISLPLNWKTPLPVTVMVNGFVKTTFLEVSPEQTLLEVNSGDGQDRIEVKGITKDYGRLRRDGKVDFGLVIPALSRRTMLNFDVSSVISPEADVIKVITKRMNVPSNISLPNQKESYILPITLDKPQYRMYFRQPGEYTMTATHGQFPLEKVVDRLRAGDSFFDVLNEFQFFGGGELDVSAGSSLAGQDISVNQYQFAGVTKLQGPSYTNDKVMLTLALMNENGLMKPSDLKKVGPGETVELKTHPKGGDRLLLSALLPRPASVVNKVKTFLDELFAVPDPINPDNVLSLSPFGDYDHLLPSDGEEDDIELDLTVALERAGQVSLVMQSDIGVNGPPQFLPLVDRPLVGNNVVSVTPPTIPEGLYQVGTYVTLSQIESTEKDGFVSEKKTRLWEFVANSWVDQIVVPDTGNTLGSTVTRRWEVMFLASPEGQLKLHDGSVAIDSITHVTRNSIDL